MNDIKIFVLEKYSDDRGYLSPFWKKNIDYGMEFVEDRVSYSKKGVLRGLHGDSETWKLIVPLHGVMQFFALPYKMEKGETSVVKEIMLDASRQPIAILLPPYYLNGHLCLSDDCVFLYKWSSYYKGEDNQVSVRYDDPELNLDWKIKEPLLSERDSHSATFKEVAVYG